jgi:hypothetical protein
LADAFELNRIDGLKDDVTLGQLASLLYEIDSQGRMKIEPKEKARVRGIASPDRAEALMLALGKPFERRLFDVMLRDLADIKSREGETIEKIAESLQATTDEVKTWLQEAVATRHIVEDPFPIYCAADGQRIPLGTPYMRIMDRYYHVECAKKAMFGS